MKSISTFTSKTLTGKIESLEDDVFHPLLTRSDKSMIESGKVVL